MRIPRPTAGYAQGKSDAELTDVILNGRRKMSAALAGNPETQHRSKIQPEEVPAVIAHVRTLRAK
jgi:hypothetical protein